MRSTQLKNASLNKKTDLIQSSNKQEFSLSEGFSDALAISALTDSNFGAFFMEVQNNVQQS